MSDKRKLTENDREKIQRLLRTGEVGEVLLAIELSVETCSEADLRAIYTDEVIASLVYSSDRKILAVAGSLFLRNNDLWDRFVNNASGTKVLTPLALRLREADAHDFTSITPSAAKLLSDIDHWRNDLDGITELSIEAAQHLSRLGSISLKGMQSLSDEIAATLAVQQRSEYGSLMLNLSGLSTLSDAASESLSKHSGDLFLDGLTHISDDAAASFSGFEGTNLSLNGLTNITDEAARVLGKYKGTGTLSLQGLTDISDNASLALQNKMLEVPSKVNVQIERAIRRQATANSVLSTKQQRKIRTLITSNDADNLALACELLNNSGASEGDWIKLFPKTRIKELLNTFDPDIWNTLVTAMNDFPLVAERLRMQAADRVNTNSTISAYHDRINEGLSRILPVARDEVIELIGATRYYRVEISAESLSDDEAAKLAKYKGYLTVRRLKELTDESGHIALCESLSKYKKTDLYLDDLTELSDAAAESLSKYRGGRLYLRGLTELSDAAAESLSKLEAAENLSRHKDHLYLNGLTELSDAAAQHLAKYKGTLFLDLDNLPASAAKILRDAGHGV